MKKWVSLCLKIKLQEEPHFERAYLNCCDEVIRRISLKKNRLRKAGDFLQLFIIQINLRHHPHHRLHDRCRCHHCRRHHRYPNYHPL